MTDRARGDHPTLAGASGVGEETPPSKWPRRFVSGSEDRESLALLLGLASLTPRRLLEAAQACRSARACLFAVRDGRIGSEGDRAHARAQRGGDILAKLPAAEARLVATGDHEYPRELSDLFDPPAGLFVRGWSLQRLEPRVAIVGARNCSSGGREIATMLGAALARAGVCVVSGGARGIDSAAHRGALDAGGTSVAVLGCGIDVPYPRQNRRLLDRIAASGALVSEYPPGLPPEPFRFPARNRIVAALSRAIVVVEGASGSGSMITADHALDLGREVFAVPGAWTSELSAVPHSLIRDGATLVRGPDDLLGDLGLEGPADESRAGEPSTPAPGLGGDERDVWDALSDASPPDTVARRTGLPLPAVISALVGLEMRSLIRHVGGRYERRLGGKGSS
jgi:DNA processing protein